MKSKLKNNKQKSNKNKLVLIPLVLLLSLSSFVAGTKYENQIKDAIDNQSVIQNNQILEFPKEAKVKRVIDGDTVVVDGVSVRLLGINTPERGEKLYKR